MGHHMTGVTEYLTKFVDRGELVFSYEVTVGNELVAKQLACLDKGKTVLLAPYVHPDHQHQELAELLSSLCLGRANSLGWCT